MTWTVPVFSTVYPNDVLSKFPPADQQPVGNPVYPVQNPKARKWTLALNRTSLLGPFCPVLGSPLLPVLHSIGVLGTSNCVVPHARKVFNTTASYEDDGVLLEIMTDTGDIGGDFISIGKTHPCDFSQRGVRLLGRGRIDSDTDSSSLRAVGQGWCRGFLPGPHPSFPDQLINSRHFASTSKQYPHIMVKSSADCQAFFLLKNPQPKKRYPNTIPRLCQFLFQWLCNYLVVRGSGASGGTGGRKLIDMQGHGKAVEQHPYGFALFEVKLPVAVFRDHGA